MPASILQYLSMLFTAEAQRVRDSVPADVRLSGISHHHDLLAESLMRMAGRIESTMQLGGVEDAEAA